LKFNEAIQELGVSDLWAGFIHQINLPVKTIEGKSHLDKQLAQIHVEGLLGHANIMLDLAHRLNQSYERELTYYNEKLKLKLEVGEMLLSEEAALGKLVPTKNLAGKPVEGLGGASNTTFESREMAREHIGELRQMYTQLSASEDYQTRLTRHGEALQVFGAGVTDAVEAVNRRVHDIMLAHGLLAEGEALGQQAGPSYFHRKNQPYYSGPSNAPARPTASPMLPGWTEDPQSEKCWCMWCRQFVPKPLKANGDLSKCEDCAHTCRDGEMRMLTTAIRQGGDQRKPFDVDADRPLKKEPHK
jgi:hypothetical protein